MLHRSLWLALLLVLLGAGCNSDCPVGRFPVDAKADGGLDRGPADLVPSRDATHAGWAISIGGPGEDGIWKSAVDPSGNLVVSGFFSGTVSFGTTTLTTGIGCSPLGGCSSFVGKLDPTGTWLWAVPLDGIPPGTKQEWDGLAVDASGNIYYAGEFRGSATFGSTTLTSRGAEDMFVVKLDPGGKPLWAVSAGGPGSDVSDALAAGSDGTLTLAGHFAGTVSFGATTHTARGKSDVVVARLDAATGSIIWATQAGSDATELDDAPGALVVDSAGNTYVTGEFGPNATFGTHSLAGKAGQYMAFVAKLDPAGSFLWAWESDAATLGTSIGRDAAGGVYIASTIVASGTPAVPLVGWTVVSKVPMDGTLNGWHRVIASDQVTQGTSILVDDKGGTTLTGFFGGKVLLGPTVLTSTGPGRNGFLAHLDPSGKVIGGQQIPTTAWSTGITLDRGPGGRTYVSGEFLGTATFGGTSLTSKGGGDAFVWNRGPEPE